ncbi:MAG: guanylate kinase, partial [Bacteroidota bacterium]
MKKMLIVTAPSGAGKTTIVRQLLKTFDDLSFSVSATTRPPRTHEVDGKDYYFLTIQEFKDRIEVEYFAEWEEVYPNKYYGTLKSEIEKKWQQRKNVVFDIEVKGATNLKKLYGDRALAIFIKPPSLEELIRRLKNRSTENEKTLLERIERAKKELTYENNFDKVLINDNLATALAEAEQMVRDFLEIKKGAET